MAKNKFLRKDLSSDGEVSQYTLTIGISTNKQIVFSFIYTKKEWSWFEFLVSWTRRIDNAGLDVYLEILMLAFRCAITDKRLWDYQRNSWEEQPKYEQPKIKYEWF
jgi:hypothetical protein